MAIFRRLITFGVLYISFTPSCSAYLRAPEPLPACTLESDAVETEGIRRLALIAGVGRYKSLEIKDLAGPSGDVQRFYQLLTGRNGYGFPEENVCVLLDEEATIRRFREGFRKALIERARPKDVAVIFFAGHGSQLPDSNGDEPDEKDESLLLHDSWTSGVGELTDDEFNSLLGELHQNTQNITVIFDSCNSGSATRASSRLQARFQRRPSELLPKPSEVADGDAAQSWIPDDLPGLVFFAAAADGTPALETGGRGIFTDALIEVLSEVGSHPMTYSQAARRIAPLVAGRSLQVPFFHGNLNGPVFGNTKRNRPIGWEVRSLGPPLDLAGPPLTGMGVGAEVRIYDGAATPSDLRDPRKDKATALVTAMRGLNAQGELSSKSPGASPIRPGDLALMVRPSDEFLKVTVRLRPSNEPGGLPAARAQAVRRAVQEDSEARLLVVVDEDSGEFELALSHNGRIHLLGPNEDILNTYQRVGEERSVVRSLWRHARRKAFLNLRGEGGQDFEDDQTLQVRVVPVPPALQNPCANMEWMQSAPNQEQIIPLCHRWNVEVTLSPEAKKPLLVGGVILSSDGNTAALPADGRQQLLNPGQTHVFNQRSETFEGRPPLGVEDRLMVFGTQETNPVPWHLLTDTAAKRAADPVPRTGLYGALDRYVRPGARGFVTVAESGEDTTWTLTSLVLSVEANPRFQREGASPVMQPEQPGRREYTIENFDIRPYLPDDPDSALHKVLREADQLARRRGSEAFPYRQHGWTEGSDEENLDVGIDTSRAIWFIFTRAGLRYNRSNQYLPTALMAGPSSLMSDSFESCSRNMDLRLGDILVYRDAKRGGGHTVMVIDPDKRIAWGTHGWDGQVRDGLETSPGAAYQLIKYRKDWEHWDQDSMQRAACWRFRRFVQEARRPGGRPGMKALQDACERACRLKEGSIQNGKE